MPSDLRVLALSSVDPGGFAAQDPRIRPLRRTDAEALADAFLHSYPPGVAAGDLAAAHDEIDAAFAGEYGVLRLDASFVVADPEAAGAILVTERSIWDEGLEGPFVIDLFVAPRLRSQGLGRALVQRAIRAVVATGDASLALRVGEGTSPGASTLYDALGFVDPAG